MYPKNSILQPLFDKLMLEVSEAGVVEQIQQTFHKKTTCTEAQEFTEIGIDFVKVLFMLLCCGVVTSLIVLIAEHRMIRIKQ